MNAIVPVDDMTDDSAEGVEMELPAVTSVGAELAQALAQACGAVEALNLDGFNAYHRYHYPTIAQVRERARQALAAAGVTFLPSIVRVGRMSRKSDSKEIKVTVVEIECLLVHASGQTISRRWIGESEDVSDKGVQKAASAAIKSFLINTLLMPVAEEENDDNGGDKSGEGQARQGQPRQPQPRQPQPCSFRPPDVMKPAEVRQFIANGVARRPENTPATPKQISLVASLLSDAVGGNDDKRHAVLRYLLGKESASELSKSEAFVILAWLLDPEPDGEEKYRLHPAAVAEIGEILREVARESGQLEFR